MSAGDVTDEEIQDFSRLFPASRRLATALKASRAESAALSSLLTAALTHVEASAGAQHLLDGFRPQVRPLDALVQEIREALK